MLHYHFPALTGAGAWKTALGLPFATPAPVSSTPNSSAPFQSPGLDSAPVQLLTFSKPGRAVFVFQNLGNAAETRPPWGTLWPSAQLFLPHTWGLPSRPFPTRRLLIIRARAQGCAA